jgi:hypothetical protein
VIDFQLEIDPDDIPARFVRLQADLPERIERSRKRLASMLLQSIKDETPVRTGALQQSLHWVPVGKTDELWGLYYGQYVIYGTRPHIIKPKNKKVLRFVIDGDVIFAKQVKHPGTKPNDFRKKGLTQIEVLEVLQDLSDWIAEQVV